MRGASKLHVRGPTGMRIEDTAFLCDLIENAIRHEIPAAEIQNIIDNIGLPYSGINLSYSNSAPVGTSDAIHPGHADTDASPDEKLRKRSAAATGKGIPRGNVRLPPFRHGDTDLELWTAGTR